MLFCHLGYPLYHLSISVLPVHALCLEHGPGCSWVSYLLFFWLWHHKPFICLSSLHRHRGVSKAGVSTSGISCLVIWGGAVVMIIEVKCTVNVMYSSYPETILPPLVHGKIVFHETDPWCQKGQGPLFWGTLEALKSRGLSFLVLLLSMRNIPLGYKY